MAVHHFTVDVEEYFQVSAMEGTVSRYWWDEMESRVEIGVDRILRLLDDHAFRGTFFVLGWVAKRNPDLVRRIAAQGHEIGSHGWGHRKVTDLDENGFRASIRQSKDVLEELTGEPVLGYRAPSFSIGPETEWAFDILLEEGYKYDSSVFPIRRPDYGFPGAGRHPFWVLRPGGALVEFPPATMEVLGANVPVGGGAYFRLFPYSMIRAGFARLDRAGQCGTFYVHPWEVDPDQPRMETSFLTQVRHYGGLRKTEGKLEQLLSDFRFQPIRDSVVSLRTGSRDRNAVPSTHVRAPTLMSAAAAGGGSR